jgi:WD40 repeat protein
MSAATELWARLLRRAFRKAWWIRRRDHAGDRGMPIREVSCGVYAGRLAHSAMVSPDFASLAEPQHALFIICAEADSWFVHGSLLPALGLLASQVRIASELPPGKPALEVLGEGLAKSRLTVVLVSRAFVADVWAKHAELLASHDAVDRSGRMVPLVLDDCAIPLRLAALVTLDLRRRDGWEAAFGRLRTLLSQPSPRPDELTCPYPGMRPFSGDEAARFFGRERDIDHMVQLLRAGERELYVVGPSGSGKSSLIAAGVLPRLRRGVAGISRVVIRSFRPGEEPCRRLAEALEREAGRASEAQPSLDAAISRLLCTGAERLLVFVDQLEELFAVTEAGERGRFFAELLALRADPRCALLFGVRADFFGALIESPLWTDGKTLHVTVAPLRGEALRQAVVQPASDLGVYFEPGLLERLLADADAEPGVMPLLQEALVQLWDRRQRRVLSLAAYEELGKGGRHGLAVAVARHADACLRRLSDAEERCARRILLRLVSFGEGAPDTRRQQPRSALAEGADPAVFTAALEALVQSRLLTLQDDARVDLAHEALLWAWPALAGWLVTRRKDEAQRRILAVKVAEWQARRCEDPGAGLLDVVELRDAEAWLASEPARDLGEVTGLAELVEQSRAERTEIARQRDKARRLLGELYLESGRQLLLDDQPQRAIPYLVAAREEHGAHPALQMLFHRASRVVVAVTLLHRANPSCAAFSPDGKRVVTASDDGTARVWDARSGLALSPLVRHEAQIKHVMFSPDGRRVLTASGDGIAQVWDAESGERVLPPLRHSLSVWSAVFSADGRRIVTASLDRSARVWDARTGAALSPPLGHRDWVGVAGFCPEGKRVVTASDDGSARVWDAASGELLAPPLSHEGEVECAAFSPDGTQVVTSAGKAAFLWDARSGAELAALRHGAPVGAAVFSADGGRVATSSDDRTARIWDARSGEALTSPMFHPAAVEHAAFDPSGAYLLTICGDRAVRLWDAALARPAAPPMVHGQQVVSASFSPDGARLITASADRAARIWDIASRPALPRLEHRRPVLDVAFSPDGARLVTVCRGHQALLWDAHSGEALPSTLAHRRPVRGAAFSPDGSRLVTASWDQTARIWDARSGALLATLEHASGVEQATFSADGRRLVTATAERVAQLWDVERAALLLSFAKHGGRVLTAELSSDGERVVTACDDGAVRLWDARSGQLVRAPLWHSGAVRGASFSPDGKRLVTACEDGSARLWDARTGKACGAPLFHAGAVLAARFSPDGARVITASADETARVWDACNSRPLAPAMEHDDRVTCAAFSADGMRAVTGSLDGAAQVWDVGLDLRSLDEWQAVAWRSADRLETPGLPEVPEIDEGGGEGPARHPRFDRMPDRMRMSVAREGRR